MIGRFLLMPGPLLGKSTRVTNSSPANAPLVLAGFASGNTHHRKQTRKLIALANNASRN
jgi:hypothetical protein